MINLTKFQIIFLMKNILTLFSLFFFIFGFSQKSLLQSGPMVGYCEVKEAAICTLFTVSMFFVPSNLQITQLEYRDKIPIMTKINIVQKLS